MAFINNKLDLLTSNQTVKPDTTDTDQTTQIVYPEDELELMNAISDAGSINEYLYQWANNGGTLYSSKNVINIMLVGLDSDDALLPYALDELMHNLNDEDVVIGGYGMFIENVPKKEVKPKETASYKGSDYPHFFQKNLLRNCEMLDSPWAKLFKRKVIGKTRFCEELTYAEDKLFVFEILAKASSVMTVSAPVYGYYVRAGSLGSDISSDAHISKIRAFIPKYASVISSLCQRCPSSTKLQRLYHNDVVGRYMCRILNQFTFRESEHLNEEFLSWVYAMMDADKHLGVFSLRAGQVPNMILYKMRKLSFSIKMYRFFYKTNRIFSRKK
jgi:hypothetical protein